ncbi:MAG: LytTR family DNA-binding domain-containing protein [Bacilli bacterium]|nr:LytTR family DNA-binding domain-containing protein [Bacilli bacterium]
MVEVAIVEDDEKDAEQLLICVKDWCKTHPLKNIHPLVYPSAIPFMEQANKVDIVFMDIEMPYMNGFDAAKKFREVNPDAILIFATRATRYAVKGYSVDAIDYLVKPIQKEAFDCTFEKALRLYEERATDNFVILKTTEGMIRLNTDHIRYLEADAHLVYIYDGDTVHKIWTKIGAIGEKLPPNFILCHRSYIVNLKYVECVLKDGLHIVGSPNKFIPISRNKREAFLAALTTYYTKTMRGQ